MGNETFAHQQELINTLGHAAGVLVFGIFLALLLRQRTAESLRRNRLPLIAAALALVWNLSSIVVLAPGPGDSIAKRAFAAIGFSVLSALPAVLLHMCFADRFRAFVLAGYALSAASTIFHLAELVQPETSLHRTGLNVITIGFSLLTVLTAATGFREKWEARRSILSRALAAIGLILLSASFAHFAEGHADDAWSAELAFHHAGIPLALFIILQNQRFVLLDAFIRFVANVFLAGAFAYLLIRGAVQVTAPDGPGTAFRGALTLVAGCLVLVAYAWMRGKLEALLTGWWFGAPDLERAARRIRELAASSSSEEEFLAQANRIVADAMDAGTVPAETLEEPLHRNFRINTAFPVSAADLSHDFEKAGVEAIVPLRFGPSDTRYLMLGPRRGGRRYLSDDLSALAGLASQITNQIEQLRQTEMRRLVTQAELKALQAQIHPHFLFNALNTLYGVIPREAQAARTLVLNLSDVLRYFFRSERSFITLEEELTVVKAYLEIEKLRLGSKLTTELDIDPKALRLSIPVLSIEPLIENAIKHGVAAQPQGGRVRLSVQVVGDGLDVMVEDTGAGFETSRSSNGNGVGLSNVERRLAICYGPSARLSVESVAGLTRVGFRVPLSEPVGARA